VTATAKKKRAVENEGAPDAEDFARLCKALGHPARIRILEHLKQADQCICGQIVEMLPLAQSTVSQHLKILKDSGLVCGEVEGPRTCYCVDKTVLARFKEMAALL
jgi:ArsR family transcriptional regulator, arsenate/arsenite/antimonite-responsive transcriptional repressor